MSVIVIIGVLLANLAPLVLGKGGGKGSSSSSSSKGSGSSKGSSSHSSNLSSSAKSSGGGTTVVVHSGTTPAQCYNSSGEVIKCPPLSAREGLILGAVLGGIGGALILAALIYFIVKNKDKWRQWREKKKLTLPSLSFSKQEYKPLQDQSEEHV
ncbi:hypothetical protein DFH07DRAFT_1012325 [Mycena maculata]|uniref:Uncharacterized protein n=1 Tax=Mycena maculata TaxID=230809 RepID=A0AAD7HDU9_9AGAR|nr:hypothetical protein DFH07DRAFT_1012325 [Mycena maculata]